MRPLLGLALVVALSIGIVGCGGGGSSSTEDLQELLPTIALQSADITTVVAEGAWQVGSDGRVSTTFGELSNGVLSDAAQQARPIDGYERTLETADGEPFREGAYPPQAYSVILLFDSASEAKSFYDAAAASVRDTDWLSAHPGLEGGGVADAETAEQTIVGAGQVDQLLWLHASGTIDGGVLSDDIAIVRQGRLVAVLRAPGFFPNTDTRTLSTSIFESGLLIPVASRVKDPTAEPEERPTRGPTSAPVSATPASE
jgi:hypothetical protein